MSTWLVSGEAVALMVSAVAVTMAVRDYLRSRTPVSLNYVGMFATAARNCRYCIGGGWVHDYQDRCLRRCRCVDAHDVVTGNE